MNIIVSNVLVILIKKEWLIMEEILMFYSTIMKIDSIDRLRDIRDALLVEQGINPTRQGEQAIKVVVERIDEIQATLDKSASRNK